MIGPNVRPGSKASEGGRPEIFCTFSLVVTILSLYHYACQRPLCSVNDRSRVAVPLRVNFEFCSAKEMSGSGQKRTFALQKTMSALPPKADISGRNWNVRYGQQPARFARGIHVRALRAGVEMHRPARCRCLPCCRRWAIAGARYVGGMSALPPKADIDRWLSHVR
jgi:hypothetical protein